MGIGARRGVSAAEVRAALDHLADLVPLDGARYASVDAKAAERGILDAIAPARLETLPAEVLAAAWPRMREQGRESPTAGPRMCEQGSARVAAAVGTPSVAEAAALLLAGPGAALLVPKTVVGRVTVACASGQGDP